LLATLFGGVVMPMPSVNARGSRIPGPGVRVATPLAVVHRQRQGWIDESLRSTGFARDWRDSQNVAASSILIDFSPAGPSAQLGFEWGGNALVVRNYDQTRAEGPVILPSHHRPSNPRAFLRQAPADMPPSSTINVSRLAETIGLSEPDRQFLVRALFQAEEQIGPARARQGVARPIAAAALAAAVFEGPHFADVLKEGVLPDRDEFKDRFLAGLNEVLQRKYNRAGAIALRRSDYASSPAFAPRTEKPVPPSPPNSACLGCHNLWSSANASVTDPVPLLAFDPFDKKARKAWVKSTPPGRRLKVLNRMLDRLARDQDMPPEDSPEYQRFRINDPVEFGSALQFLVAELARPEGN
jgi:hypothetical protein